MTRVLLISSNRETSPAPAIPLGLCAVASSASAAGFDVSVEDLCFVPDPLARVRQSIEAKKPDVIGVSIRNIDSSDSTNPTWFLPEMREIMRTCKDAGNIPVIIGGPAVSVAPRQVMDFVGADYAVVGDGEEAFPALLRALETGSDPLSIGGVLCIGESSDYAASRVSDLDQLPRAQIDKWLDIGRYSRHAASLPIQTKRGCAFECDYCLYGSIEGSKYRLRSPMLVADEIAYLKSAYPGASFEFVDSTFNCPEDHAIRICEELARRGNTAPLQSVEFNPAYCSDELLRAMESAGFVSLGVTPESASDVVLSGLHKGFTSDMVYHTAQKLRSTSMMRLWIFMLGGPDETEETARETLKFIETQLTNRDVVYITYGIRIWPRTGLYIRACAEGIVSAEDDLLKPTFYTSPRLSLDHLRNLIGQSSFPSENIVFASDGNHPGLRTVQRLSALLRIKPPYWRYAPMLNKTVGRLVKRVGR